jgi:hypothetical protein
VPTRRASKWPYDRARVRSQSARAAICRRPVTISSANGGLSSFPYGGFSSSSCTPCVGSTVAAAALSPRHAVVAVRKDLINTVRGLVKSMGTRLPKCSTESFAKKVEGALPTEVRDALLPLVRLVEALSSSIKEYDERIEKLATEKYPHTKLLRQVKGVATNTLLKWMKDPGFDAAYLLAHVLAVTAVGKGEPKARWLAAATMDRYLMSLKQPQVFGTQFHQDSGAWTMDPYDRAAFSDAIRASWCVASQAEQAQILKDIRDGRPFRSTYVVSCK